MGHTHRGRTHTPTVAVPTHSPWPYPHTHHGRTHQMGELTRIVHEMNALDELKQINTTGRRRDPLRPGGAPLASALESDARKLDLQPAKVAAALCSSLDLAPSAVVVDVGAGTGDHASQPASTARVPRVYGVSPYQPHSPTRARRPLRARVCIAAAVGTRLRARGACRRPPRPPRAPPRRRQRAAHAHGAKRRARAAGRGRGRPHLHVRRLRTPVEPATLCTRPATLCPQPATPSLQPCAPRMRPCASGATSSSRSRRRGARTSCARYAPSSRPPAGWSSSNGARSRALPPRARGCNPVPLGLRSLRPAAACTQPASTHRQARARDGRVPRRHPRRRLPAAAHCAARRRPPRATLCGRPRGGLAAAAAAAAAPAGRGHA